MQYALIIAGLAGPVFQDQQLSVRDCGESWAARGDLAARREVCPYTQDDCFSDSKDLTDAEEVDAEEVDAVEERFRPRR